MCVTGQYFVHKLLIRVAQMGDDNSESMIEKCHNTISEKQNAVLQYLRLCAHNLSSYLEF